MKCPFCEKDLPGHPCPRCGGDNPEEALFCMHCGAAMTEAGERPDLGPDEDDEGIDFENRVLCPDGACTGIIVNGKCSECGKAWPPEGDQPPADAE